MAAQRYKNHDEYLAKVPPEVVRKRLEVFHLNPGAIDVKSFICLSFEVKAPFLEYIDWLHPLKPEGLHDLKNWFGVPNEVARRMLSKARGTSAESELLARANHELPRALPMKRHYKFESLDNEQKLAVRQTARNLLHGYVDPEQASQPPLAGVINYMIAASDGVKIFVAPDLVVCPDTVVKFKNVPALFFNNILIYGNGRIVTESKTKIHSYQIQHVD